MAPSGSSISMKYIIFAAALIGTFQAVAWFVLSLVSILFYESVIDIGDIPEDSYGRTIYEFYLNKNNDFHDKFIIYPKTFNYFMFIYLAMSFIWLIASCFTLWAVIRGKWNFITKQMIFWSCITIAIAILDITLMSLVAVDIQQAHDLSNTTTSVAPTTIIITTPTSLTGISTTVQDTSTNQYFEMLTTDQDASETRYFQDRSLRMSKITSPMTYTQTIYTSMGIVMSVAARGYILWIFNITFAIMLIVLVQRIRKMNRPTLLPPIDAYDIGPRPFNLYEQTEIGNGHLNNAFNLDESIIFSPRQMLDPLADNTSRNPLSNSNRSSITNPQPQVFFNASRPNEIARGPHPVLKLAKIGKSGGERRTPPLNIPSPVLPSGNMPYIPDPDYTPPASPNSQPKSVLRPRSKYVL